MEAKPLVVIVGPTASGKTGLAIELAEKYGGEIICADSRTVYKGMDVGTAKPTVEDQARVKHWGINLVTPDQRFTAADFKAYAEQKINEIRGRGHIPFLVGGTGLYVDAVIFNYEFGPPADVEFRQRLESMTIEELHIYCKENNIKLPENEKNKRYVIRAIEQKSINSKRSQTPIANTIIVGIATESSELRTRIEHRSEQLFQDGVVEEAKRLGEMYGWDSEAMTGNIYPLCHQYINNEITLDQLKEKFVTLDRRLVKRQLTWFKRNQLIKWLSLTEASGYLSSVLASEH
jgi:tRNA dimethylallyltransferase